MNRQQYTEDQLVEQPAIQLFEELGWTHINAYYETLGSEGTLGRDNKSEVFLAQRLRAAIERLNPDTPAEAVDQAVSEITRPRAGLHYARANQQIHTLLRERVPVLVRQPDGTTVPERLRIIDWDNPDMDDFLLVSQFWVHSDLYHRRADLVGFVNGIPLVFIELKASHRNLQHAYDDNLRDYRDTIPQLFIPNGFLILSNGADTKVGTITSGWEFFSEWKKINFEGEEGAVSLETVIRGMCTKERLLDLIENFVVFQDLPGGFVKLVARNHQYLGVNNAIGRLGELRDAPPDERGKLGVFWHTQGSGKTMSMLFFSQKVLRKIPGNWSFVIVTDRGDLDEQAYKEFVYAGVITEKHMRATGSAHLRQLLREDHRYVFTLIQKFRTETGATHPVVSQRDDVIVIADEAHRTQYDILAVNMRTALPNARFLAFTGTPLIAGEEATRREFGKYVSIYNFANSVADHATVPLFYENRIPQLEISNPRFGDDLMAIVEEADFDDAAERKLARALGQQYELITRDDRLQAVAQDIVDHFLGRGFPGKAMVVSIDKVTAVRTYEKVKRIWTARLDANARRLATDSLTPSERDLFSQENAFMRSTDMAVVISQSQNEIAEMTERGLDIEPHRKRIVDERLEDRFKDPEDPFRLAFVCAMWTTGFDVPSLSTVYLDKPLRNHTLMQTITRANRVFPAKNNGLIVAYVDVFKNLQKALSLYAVGGQAGNLPLEGKEGLVDALRDTVADIRAFCGSRDVDLDALGRLKGFDLVAAGKQTVEMLMVDDDEKVAFMSRASQVDRLFKAILPDKRANEFGRLRAVTKFLADTIAGYSEKSDIGGVLGRIEQLLDESVAANQYLIPANDAAALFDLSTVDWGALEEAFKQGRPRTAAQRLRSLLAARIAALVRLNPARVDLVERFEKLVADYNAGSLNTESFFQELMAFSKALTEEEARALSEGLSEEQLAIFDLLMRPAPKLSDEERVQVRRVAEELLAILKREKIVLDWRKEQSTRAAVRVTVEETLDRLPEAFTRQLYAQKCDAVYQHVFDSYWDDGHSVYDRAA
ncbi:MAG TPA: type I restriction endonuclease subunit R [Candidatus Acidoferrales bacterium]|nr:type I restriction endonuclease subunit R [Candidatus Acidoferrales bacterium]HVC23611.1 type I restriction endonuclease subunit R [Candidatus Dormibacteraeota bacterium]